jgi:toxin FitB
VLLDTCVLSDLQRAGGDPQVRAAVAALQDDELFLSVITIGELTRGVLRLAAGKRKADLNAWLQNLKVNYASRILPVDGETAEIWGEISARAEAQGRIIPAADGLIAASALQHGLHIFTRNVEDFRATGAMISNPWVT